MVGSYLAHTDPADVARVEGKTFIISDEKYETVPHVAEGVKGVLGQWMPPDQWRKEIMERFPGCMKGQSIFKNEVFFSDRVIQILAFPYNRVSTWRWVFSRVYNCRNVIWGL